MTIYACSDLHLDQKSNFEAFLDAFEVPASHKQDVLILAGDICETEAQLHLILSIFKQHYQEVIWTPGNHELWIRPSEQEKYSGSPDKYQRLVEICRQTGVHCPEDRYFESQDCIFVPLFILYDYSFRAAHVPLEEAVNWAMESNLLCTDEVLIHKQPFNSVTQWCEQRVHYSLERLKEIEKSSKKVVLINHFPMKECCIRLYRIPRFSIWCGTRATEDWHRRFNAHAVITGHLHMPDVQKIDEVDFYEVSLGYPGQWNTLRSMKAQFREIPA